MLELYGKYNNAKIFTDNVEQEALSQIYGMLNEDFTKDSIIRIMPDVHAGAGCTIGTTMTINNKIVPNLVGVDIGCGMLAIKLNNKTIDLKKLDEVIKEKIPSGANVREHNHIFTRKLNVKNLKSANFVNMDRAYKSLGTLGGGNHFIELNKDDNGFLWLVIHTGSRYLGKQVAESYQRLAIITHSTNSEECKLEKENIIKKLKGEGKSKEIEKQLNIISNKYKFKGNKDLAYLEGKYMSDYLHDMNICQDYAKLNRDTIAYEIITNMNLDESNRFTTVHNYIDLNNMILRKGSVSSKENELLIIPMNMRDGSLICVGKGNIDWNCSAPHGAGRIMSRSKAKDNVTFEEFKESMNGIYTTSVCESTIDESPMVYKPMEEIIKNIKDTADIINIIKPIYNFKAH